MTATYDSGMTRLAGVVRGFPIALKSNDLVVSDLKRLENSEMDQLYEEAAKIHEKVLCKSDSLKSLVFGSNIRNKKALYALVCESLKCKSVLADIKEECGPLKQDKFFMKNEHLGNVLLYEHALGKGVKGKYAAYLKKHKVSINTQVELKKVRAGVTNLKQLVVTNQEDFQVSVIPKYVRINTLQTSTDRVYSQMAADGYIHVSCDSDSFTSVVSQLEKKSFTTDPHIPNLLVFPPNTDFHDNPLYTSGKIILQDKASCVPAYILSPPQGTSVIDCCAAPGNKTSHLASIMANKGTVFAFDKSKNRLATLKKQMQKAGASCVRADHKDFLTVDPADASFKNVEYILVDPSCSGSGMVNRVTQHTDETESASEERLTQLSKFQTSILKHALSFPRVKQVVYSTCSIHEQENEGVVQEVLSKCSDSFQLLHIMPEWPHRGLNSFDVGPNCIRMTHENALTNGFFVACFERRSNSEKLSSIGEESRPEENIVEETDCIDLKFNANNNNSSGGLESIISASKKKKKKSKKHKEGNIETKQIEINGQDVAPVEISEVNVSTLDHDQIVKKKENVSKKKRKKNKKYKVELENKGELQHQSSMLGKRQHADSDLDHAEKKANACKKKRKKSKERKLEPDSANSFEQNDQRLNLNNYVSTPNMNKTNACKKKREKK